MSKFRIILHVILVTAVISASISGFELEKNNVEYMPKSEADRLFAQTFYQETASVLESIGAIAEFNDKYGIDTEEVVEGITVGQLKEEYMNDYSLEEYETIRMNLFQYNEDDLDSTGSYMSDEDGLYYDSEAVAKYGHTTYEGYINAYEYYSKIIDFFYDYELYRDAEDEIHYKVSNLQYIVKYTDENGNLIQYPQNGVNLIEQNPEYYTKQFLYDKANETSLMNGLDKEFAGFETLVYKCKTFTDYDDFYAVFAVNNTYPYTDSFSYYDKEVITDEAGMASHNICFVIFVLSIVIVVISLVVLMFLTGRVKKGDYILYAIDRAWWDLLGVTIVVFAGIVLLVFNETSILEFDSKSDYVYVQSFCVITSELLVVYILSLIRRLKTRTFLNSSVTGKLIKRGEGIAKRLWNRMSATKKAITCLMLAMMYMIIVCLSSIWIYYYESILFLLIWMVLVLGFLVVVFYVVWKFQSEYDEIAQETKKIANGDITNKIAMEIKFMSNKNMADAVNSIGEGIAKAVDESVKNERMKTDLITNVSHDIKTPLTSIINYVNLLKMENIEDEKVKNYLRILEEKSNRLKILTDDLVEASKLSSGVIKLEYVKLNLAELIRQSAGEFEEKFEEKHLEVVMNLPMAPIYVNGDGRKMWRVLENLYGNIYKYALKGTRVYVDLATVNGKVILTVKNISNSPLNFQSDELTERFIRGDVSRSTEGSGLGLSIAKSIIDRHGGEFKIVLDGDLFKIVIKLNEYNEDKEVKLNENK